MRTAAEKSTTYRSFAAAAQESPLAPGASAPSIFDKIISLTIVDPSGARRKINGMVGEFPKKRETNIDGGIEVSYFQPCQPLNYLCVCPYSFLIVPI